MTPLVAVGSVKGSPGATVTALALVAAWPDPGAVFLEADGAGGDVAAWLGEPQSTGLIGLASALRRGASPGAWEEHGRLLACGITAVTAPGVMGQVREALLLLERNGYAGLRERGDDERVLVADIGRIEDRTIPLVRAADALLVVTRGGVDAMVHVAGRMEELRGYTRHTQLLVVAETPYRYDEMASAFGIRHVHGVPWDPQSVRALCSSRPPRRWLRRPLMAAAREAAATLQADVGDLPQQVAALPPTLAAPSLNGADEMPQRFRLEGDESLP